MSNNGNCDWTYLVLEDQTPQKLSDEVKRFINNNLSDNQRRTYKIAQDDRRSECPHAVIFYDLNGIESTIQSVSPVETKEFKASGTSKSKLELACDEAKKWLNKLSDEDSLCARMVLSNSKNPAELLMFYYPGKN